jgi:hypothetical protein
MYEETDKKMSINWPSLILKLVLIVLAVILIIWVVKTLGGKTSSGTTVASSEYTTNINNMKAAGFEYFTGDNLPSKVGDTKKLTLEELINQKLVVDFTNNGKTCDVNKSFVQATKTSDNNFALKVALSCDEKDDYLVTTIDQSTLAACNAAKTAGESCLAAVKELEQTVKDSCTSSSCKNSASSSSNSSTSKSSNSSSSYSSKSNGSSSNNTSSNYSNSGSSTTTTTTTTTSSIHITYTFTCTTCGNTTTDDNKKTEDNKTLWYKHVKYSEWIQGTSSDSNIQTKNEVSTSTTTCPTTTTNYYTTGWLGSASSYGRSYNYTLKFLKLTGQDLYNYQITGSGYYGSNDYQAYINQRNQELYMLGDDGSLDAPTGTASEFASHSLKAGNFVYSFGSMYKSGSDYYTKVYITYYNGNGVTPYYYAKAAENIYYVPIRFTVSYQTQTNCTKSVNVPYYRTVTYIWSKNATEPGYTYTGISEYR